MPGDQFQKFLVTEIQEMRKDIKHLLRFRWMVMGGAATSAFIFTVLFEIAKAMAGAK